MVASKGKGQVPREISSAFWDCWVAGTGGIYRGRNDEFVFVTDSSVEEPIPGKHSYDEVGANSFGIVLRRADKFFLVTRDGREHFIVEFPCKNWSVGDTALYPERNGRQYALLVDWKHLVS